MIGVALLRFFGSPNRAAACATASLKPIARGSPNQL